MTNPKLNQMEAETPFTKAAGTDEERDADMRRQEDSDSNVVDFHARPTVAKKAKAKPLPRPADWLPLPKGAHIFGAPAGAMPYHTQRAEGTRQRAWADVGPELQTACQTLFDAGVRRSNPQIADVADHNAMTLAYALQYAEHGLHVVDSYALDPRTGRGMSKTGDAKAPLGAGWQNRATTDRAAITDAWIGKGEYPKSKSGEVWPYKSAHYPRNVAMVLQEGCNLFVLDEDGEEGQEAVRQLEAKHGPLPRTLDSLSGSGKGRHRFFRTSRPIRNTASAIASGVDIRGEGGQVIVAPSIHSTGNFYHWAEGCAPGQVEIADAPEWLENLAFDAMRKTGKKVKAERRAERRVRKTTATGKSHAVGFTAILAEIGDGDGLRGFNDPIYRAACSWWGRNPDGDEEELFSALEQAIIAAPCKNGRALEKYATEDYLSGQITNARDFINRRRSAETEADREEGEAREAARAFLRENLVTEDGETRLAASAAKLAIAHLVGLGIEEEDAADFVADAAGDVLRQLEGRASDPVSPGSLLEDARAISKDDVNKEQKVMRLIRAAFRDPQSLGVLDQLGNVICAKKAGPVFARRAFNEMVKQEDANSKADDRAAKSAKHRDDGLPVLICQRRSESAATRFSR